MRIQLRQGSAAAWTAAATVLAAGEPGYETDTGKFKIGTGVAAWATLPYAGSATPAELTMLGLVAESTSLFGVRDPLGLAAGTFVAQLWHPGTVTISKLSVWLHAAGATSVAGVNGLALYTEAGVLLSQTGDMTTQFAGAADTWQEGTLAVAQSLSDSQSYYWAALAAYTTAPQILGINAGGALPLTNGHYPSVFLAAQTAFPASFTPSAATRNNGVYWFGAR